MRVYIAEKPSLARLIAAALGGSSARKEGYIEAGNGDQVTWCFGHMYEQAAPDDYDPRFKAWRRSDLPIVPEVWQLNARPDAKKQIKVIQSLLKQATEVVNAGDPDREGQLLVDELIEELNYRGTVLRIWIKDLTDAGICAAIDHIQLNSAPLYVGLSQSALARSRADWLVGMNLSRAYTLAARNSGHDGVISIGRVQTPTLALVVKRDLEIEAFTSVPFFGIEACFRAESGEYCGQWLPREGNEAITDEHGRCLKKEIADAAVMKVKVKGTAGEITSFEAKDGKILAPLPFSLSELQSYASAKWGMSAQRVLDVAQALYEQHKATSYPRTDCGYLSENQHSEVEGVLVAIEENDPSMSPFVSVADTEIKGRAFNDKKVSAHTGIVPTQQRFDMARMSEEEAQVYDAIRRRYLIQFYRDHTFRKTTFLTEVAGETFKTTGKMTLVPGWRVVITDPAEEDKPDENSDSSEKKDLPLVKKGQAVDVIKASRQDKKTKPPSRWTEGTLIKAMANIAKFVDNPEIKARLKETSGIGTEATRAGILETLKRRDFINPKGKQLISTEIGRGLIQALPAPVSSPETTALWEQELANIAANAIPLNDFMAKQVQWVRHQIEGSSEIAINGGVKGPQCPKCTAGTVLKRKGKKGYFWGCSRYPECSATFSDKGGKPDLSVPKEGPKCPKCDSGILMQRSGKYGNFWGCNGFQCKTTFRDKKGEPNFDTSPKK